MIELNKIYNEDFRIKLSDIGEDFTIITDPPYNIGFKYNSYADNLPDEEYVELIAEPDESDEEYNITEVTEELLGVMEYDGVTSAVVPEGLRKDIWKLVCGEEECESDTDNAHDPVYNPSHYNHGELETITIIEMLLTEEEYRGYLKGNILKYRERAPYKGNAEQDYAKARWYFDELFRIGF